MCGTVSCSRPRWLPLPGRTSEELITEITKQKREKTNMTSDRHTREQMRAHCDHLGEEDGLDPRQFAKTKRPMNQQNRKALQLCRQVAETLNLVLTGEFDDALLYNLQVVSVTPAPDASQLSVALRADLENHDVHPQQILDRLERVAGKLRSEVAASITRKRTPRLLFYIIDRNTLPD